jgi:hypothetical protein
LCWGTALLRRTLVGLGRAALGLPRGFGPAGTLPPIGSLPGRDAGIALGATVIAIVVVVRMRSSVRASRFGIADGVTTSWEVVVSVVKGAVVPRRTT